MSRFRIPSGGILDYKALFSPSSGKQVCCSLLLLKQSYIRVTDGTVVKKPTILVEHGFAILS